MKTSEFGLIGWVFDDLEVEIGFCVDAGYFYGVTAWLSGSEKKGFIFRACELAAPDGFYAFIRVNQHNFKVPIFMV